VSFDVVIPTLGRPSLARLLGALGAQPHKGAPTRVIIAADRRCDAESGALATLDTSGPPEALAGSVVLVRAAVPGPAAARNAGWRASRADWIAFLDDDVVPGERWYEALARDLEGLGSEVGGSQGRVRVPLAAGRRPTDWERNVAGLEAALWATADMAYRRDVLEKVGGFDQRFRRAYREDADIGLRVTSLGLRIVRGERVTSHPPGPAPFWTSVRLQRGNADDALMRRLHGHGWRERAGAPRGRLHRHALSCGAALLALAARLAACRRIARLAALGAAAGTAELTAARILPGPRGPAEVVRMIATSVVLPFAAVRHRLLGELRWRGAHA
jgi:glycosyltransferase involved in cell wall biosynthesis